MAFGPDSPLRRLPAALDERQPVFYDAIRYSGQMVSIAYNRLRTGLYNAGKTFPEGGVIKQPFEPIFLDAWSVVDSTHRFSRLIHSTPDIEHGTPVKLFERRIAGIEELRNGVQHLHDEEIRKLVQNKLPAFGSLSWAYLPDIEAKRLWICTLLSGSIVTSKGHPIVNPIDKDFDLPVDHIELTAFGTTVSISKVYRAVESLGESLEAVIAPQVKEHPHLASDASVVMMLGWNETQAEPAESSAAPSQ